MRTLAVAYPLLRQGYPDYLLLKRGDIWQGALPLNKSGRSANEPMVYGSYGVAGAARPKLVVPDNSTGLGKYLGGGSPLSTDFISISGLHVEPLNYQGTTQTLGLFWLGAGSNILVEDCLITGFAVNVALQSDAAHMIRNVTLRRNLITNSYSREDIVPSNGHSQGVITGGVDGLSIIENLIDHNGYKEGVAEPNVFNHNLYIAQENFNVIIRGNISSRASSHGLQLRNGGEVTDNLFVRDPLAMFTAGSDSYVADNVIIEGTDIDPSLQRADGITVLQSTTLVENNIIANKLSDAVYSMSALSVGYSDGSGLPTSYSVVFDKNIVYNWGRRAGSALNVADGGMHFDSVTYSNNIIQQNCPLCTIAATTSATANPSKVFFRDNIYSADTAGSWFDVGGWGKNFDQWRTEFYPDNSTVGRISFKDPTRNVDSYYESMGGVRSFDAFVAGAVAARKWEWSKFSAAAVNTYIRDGFEIVGR